MNSSVFIGVIACATVVYFGIVHGLSAPSMLLNSHAIILVMGGTVAITLFSYSMEKISEVWNFVKNGFFFKKTKKETAMIEDLLVTVKNWYNGSWYQNSSNHPFVNDSFRILNEGDISASDVTHILNARREAVARKYFEDAKVLNNIAKYPPHLGLLGASSGMIQMMMGLGKGGIETIGSAMAVALTATLWGIFLNNFIFLPLSDSATKAAEDEMYIRNMIVEAVILIKKGHPEKVVTETVVSRLSAPQRIALKSKFKQLANGGAIPVYKAKGKKGQQDKAA
ncbi:MAG: MotA/TolQ/ExbB proton channel family protein [Pseudobdellovibrio sp.]|uniref:motility protein A n=1 Tax=Pseudobdellovibrio sp. HCB154 TaxID=3386277 RepID=UPI0039175B64|nr:MotA/TolQ/ExbB proton channel family protein [Pseudobdellovibrio sp.]